MLVKNKLESVVIGQQQGLPIFDLILYLFYLSPKRKVTPSVNVKG